MTLSRAQSSAKIIQDLIAAMFVQELQAISDQTWMPTSMCGILSST
jgi:hypothetical protein